METRGVEWSGDLMLGRNINLVINFISRYWDQYYPGGQYDAIGRRSAGGGPLVAGMAAASPVASPAKSAASKIKKSVSSTSVAPSDSTSSINVSKKSAAPASPIKKMIAVAGGGWEKEKKAIMADYARITAGLNEQAMELKVRKLTNERKKVGRVRREEERSFNIRQ